MISQIKSESIKIDLVVTYIEMMDLIETLDSKTQFDIISRVVEIAYKSTIESHKKSSQVPKEIYKLSLKQGNMSPIDFVKSWIKGDLEVKYYEDFIGERVKTIGFNDCAECKHKDQPQIVKRNICDKCIKLVSGFHYR